MKLEHYSLSKLVEEKTEQLEKSLESLEEKVKEVGSDVKELLPGEKRKYKPLPLRDPITKEMFQLFVYNAGAKSKYQQDLRKAQLRIAYTLLYYVGLRLNELRLCRLEQIEEPNSYRF